MFRTGLVVASFLLVSGVASAQERSGDVVVLKDGTILQGTVGEMIPNQSITITIDGTARKIDWKDIDRVNIDRAKATPPVQTAAARTMVHIEGVGPDAFVQTLDQHGSTEWTEVCKGSCDQELPSGALYRIRGSGLRASPPFRLEGPRADLHVKTASSVGFIGGLSLVIFGGVAVVNGLSLFLVAEIDKDVISPSTHRDFFIAGGVLGGLGVGAFVVGAILLGGNLRTTVAGAPTVRIPAWRDAPTMLSGSRLATFTFPAFSGSF